MATRIRHKRSAVAGNIPSAAQLQSGELAINTADGKVYLLRDDNTIQDITKRIFEGNSEIKVDDLADSTVAAITMTVNDVDKMTITNAGFNVKDNVDLEDASKLTFRELTASGEDGVSLKAPDSLAAGYALTLPPSQGTIGQLLAIDSSGGLFFNDADIFGGNVIYVSQEQGDDTNDGQSAPVKTVKRACQIASSKVYNADGTVNFKRINVKVAVGDYTEDNPVIVPDNTVIKGDGLRGCIIRPANANLDILRVRNACYFGEFTFRDGIDENQVPLITGDYCVAFDDPIDAATSRVGYTNLPSTRPTITTSPYIQNCSILSFLGLNGAKIDGSKVSSPNVPLNQIEAENPVVGSIPEQGKSMVANAFTMLSFGGTGWRLTNDAYAQIVSCFQIFLLNGVYTQSGGYCSITNSATNFGLYALRSSGYSPKAFQFDRAFASATGASEGKQTITTVGINRTAPVEEFVLRFRDPGYYEAYNLLLANRDAIAADTVTFINSSISGASASIWAGYTYSEAKCRRDTALLIEGIYYDILFNSNYRSVSNALRYFSGSFPTFASQKAQHVDAFGQTKTQTDNALPNATLSSRANALWDEIIDIINNGDANTVPGDSVAAAYTRPLPSSGSNNASDSGYANAVTQILNNKAFITAELTAWLNVQIAAENAPFVAGFTYNQAKCERDTGLVIDALVYDLTYGGNLQTFNAAAAYFIDGVAQYGTGQQEETVAAYGRLKEVIEKVIVETAVIKSSGNSQNQNTSASAGSSTAATTAGNRVKEISDYISGGGASLPTKLYPDTSWVGAASVAEVDNALGTVGAINIAQQTTQYINEQIQANIWYNFTYNQAKCNRDTQLVVEAVAKDVWDTGNRYSRSAGLSYYTRNLQDSTQIAISGQELQTIAALEKAKLLAVAYLSSLSTAIQDFAGTRFEIVKTIINDPTDLPEPTEVSSEGDVTNSFKTSPTETTFNAATSVNVAANVIFISGHGFTNGQKVIYSPAGNNVIIGLDDEQTYFIKLVSVDEFGLTFDESGDFNVDIRAASTGTHKFFSNVIEFFTEEIISSHTTYQTLILESGAESYVFTPGKAISGTTGSTNNSAIVAKWTPRERELVVSIEEVTVGSSTLRVQFDSTSVITADHAGSPNTSITVNETAAKTGLGTATFSITATDGSASLSNLSNLPEKQVWFHRPSIVNSSSHTWEYAGSGTDYNALPQNGGNTKEQFEQFEELPGRVYSSGTNELGDFKVGDFITAFNRTGNITFRNKVQVDELDALKLSLSNVAIEEISTSVNLGDDELGGPSNARLSTQLAVRSFISNRLGGFVDKSVSTAAVPGAIVQLNTNGQLNPDLIPATRQFTNTNTQGYLSKLLQVDDIPAKDLKAGDIATENYEQVELILQGVTFDAADGDTITQPGIAGAIGYAKNSYANSGNVLVATVGEAWDATDDSVGDPWDVSGSAPNLFVNGVDSGVKPTSKGAPSAIVDNFFLKSSNSSQFLVLDPADNYTFTSAVITNAARASNVLTITTSGAHNLNVSNNVNVIVTENATMLQNGVVLSVPTTTTFTMANTGADVTSFTATGSARTIATSADGNAQGAVTETRVGVCTNVDNANITSGSGYTPTSATQVYKDVALTTSGSGTGAVGDITVTAGAITDIDLKRGGVGYTTSDTIGVAASNVGGTGSGFSINITAIEKRIYVNILGGELFVASSSSIDFVEDNTSVVNGIDINLNDILGHNFLAGVSGSGGSVNYTDSRIIIANHGFTNGDPLLYTTGGNVAIGGLLNNKVYYAKVIDTSTIELYNGFALLSKITFTSTPANNNHNVTRSVVNITDNSVLTLAHGLTTGDAIRIESLSDGSTTNVLPTIDGVVVPSGSRFFIGSVTTNSFTLHDLRSDALSSINDLVTNAKDITVIGVGSAEVIANNTQVNAVVNTSSSLKANWNTLAVTNIDAENIISGTVSPSRLGASGVANSDSFLRGDSAYAVVVQTLKKLATTDNPITLTGSSVAGEFFGDPVNIGISNVDNDAGNSFSTLGTSRFLQTQFNVNTDASGEVFIKDGVIDAGTLDALDSAYFLNPANLTSPVPVTRGGTNITTYAVGDMLFAQSTGTLNPLNIGRNNAFLKSNGTTPEWGTALDLSEGLDVGSAKLSSSSIGSGQLYNDNVTSLEIGGDAVNIKIGNNAANRNLISFVESYEATVSQSVVVNLENVTGNTNAATGNGEKEIPLADTSNVLAGMTVTGSGSIPANTTVSGVTTDYIYLSVQTSGTILSGTSLTFRYTPQTLGIKVGDYITIGSSTVTNLDGRWPVTGATANATSFTVQTDANVTADPLDSPVGTIVVDANMIIRNRNVVFGPGDSSATPTNSVLKGSDGIGTNINGGNITLQTGLSTGNATGGSFVIKTGEVGTSGDIQQTSTTRLTIDTVGDVTIPGYTKFTSTAALKLPVGTTAQRGASAQGQVRYNSDDTTFEGYDGSNWGSLGGVKDVDQDTFINAETSAGADNDTLDFHTNGTQRAQIGAAGDFGYGDSLNKFTIAYTSGDTNIAGDVVVTGDLTVNGTTTTLNSTTLQIDDKNIELGTVATPSDTTADGGGITLKGATDHTWNWINSSDAWTSSEHIDIVTGKEYKIANASVLNATTLGSAIVNSSLQQVGTISTGTWQGTIIDPTYGGTGVNNGSKTITLGGNFTHTGAHTLGLTTSGATSITLPTSGTLAIIDNPLSQFASTTSTQLAGVLSDETGTGVAVFGTSPTITTSIIAGSVTMGLLDTTATTINMGGDATTVAIGAATGTTTIHNALDVDLDLNLDGGDIATNASTFNLINTTSTTINAFGAATDINIGAATGDFGVANATANFAGNLFVNGTTLDTDETGTFNLLKDNATTLAFAQAATEIVVGETKAAATSASALGEMIVRLDLRTNADMYIDGDLFVSAINNTPIGNVTPSTGAFTTLAANNFVTFTDATNATGATFALGSASVKMTGGLYVAKDIRADNLIGDIDASLLTSGSVADARIVATNITQHQASITGTGALDSGSITANFGNINIGTGIFSGVGSGLSTLNASNLSSGTVADDRISSTSIVQHQGDITGTGIIASGSISSGFGNIDIGTNTFTGNGSGLTTLNADNLSSGTVSGSRLGGSQSMAGVKSFTDVSAATTTTTGAVRIAGGLGVAGDLYAGSLNGVGSGITSLAAGNISSGTIGNARITGTYSNLTGTGALDAGEITSNFGNINIGTSTFTGNGSGLTTVDAATLDSIDSTSFLRSDADDTATGMITISKSGEMLKLSDTSASGNPYIGFYQGATRRGYVQFVDAGGLMRIASDENNEQLDVGSGTNGLKFNVDGTGYTVWHSGNDGSGSGLNADTLDGVSSGSFLRSDANDTFTGTISGTGSISISGNVGATAFTGDGSGLTGISADDANTLDGLDSSAFLRANAADQKTSGSLRFNDNIQLNLGTGDDTEIYHNGSNQYIDLNTGDLFMRDGTTTRFTLTRSSGNLTVTGEVTAYSDATLKDNIQVIADPLTKILSIRGVTFTRTDVEDTESKHMGVIAQEVEEYFPEVVHTNVDGIKSVNYGAMAGAFIEAFKEQQSQIDELRLLVQKLADK